MIKNNDIFNEYGHIMVELQQSYQEGRNTEGYDDKVRKLSEMDDSDPEKAILIGKLYDELQSLPMQPAYKYYEPSDLNGIKAVRPASRDIRAAGKPVGDSIYDKVYGAWLGRCVGCLLGMPFEDWYMDRMYGFLKETGNFPITYFASSDVHSSIKEKYNVTNTGTGRFWINNIEHMPEDDDTNYTVIGLRLLETYGMDFTPDNVGECWFDRLPLNRTFTAERIAFRNMIKGFFPPESASFRNPFREWIGAQIRADIFGYVTPGNPELGAELAWRDASISHVKNGIYGEMFVAAMLSWAAVNNDAEEIINIGLSQIPENSRLAEKIGKILNWKKDGIGWEEAINRVHEMYNEKMGQDSVHTISNAMLVCIGLIYGELDFEKSVGISVLGAMDTDCNGATVGSIVGMILGAKALPEKWVAPLNDKLLARVEEKGIVRISELAKRTVKLIK